MRIILLIAFLISAPAFAGKEWFDCKSDAECTMGEGPCGDPSAINKKFLPDQEKKNAEVRPLIKCMNYKGPTKDKLEPKCHEGKCRGNLKKN